MSKRERHMKYIREYNNLNREKVRRWNREVYYRLRDRVLVHLSADPPYCLGCGIIDKRVLTVDHIYGGGGKERKELGWGPIFRRILSGEFLASNYRVLCHNCQHLARLGEL